MRLVSTDHHPQPVLLEESDERWLSELVPESPARDRN
jgi:hypothetical protein